jgi:hypothetical protein
MTGWWVTGIDNNRTVKKEAGTGIFSNMTVWRGTDS